MELTQNDTKIAGGHDSCGVHFVMEDSSILSHAFMDRWNKRKWYQKILGFFSRKYKNRYIDIEPFKAKLLPKGREFILRGGIVPDCKATEEDNNYVL